jgi:hypothetical protein
MRAIESAAIAAMTSEAEMREILDGFAGAAILACLPVRLVDLSSWRTGRCGRSSTCCLAR